MFHTINVGRALPQPPRGQAVAEDVGERLGRAACRRQEAAGHAWGGFHEPGFCYICLSGFARSGRLRESPPIFVGYVTGKNVSLRHSPQNSHKIRAENIKLLACGIPLACPWWRIEEICGDCYFPCKMIINKYCRVLRRFAETTNPRRNRAEKSKLLGRQNSLGVPVVELSSDGTKSHSAAARFTSSKDSSTSYIYQELMNFGYVHQFRIHEDLLCDQAGLHH